MARKLIHRHIVSVLIDITRTLLSVLYWYRTWQANDQLGRLPGFHSREARYKQVRDAFDRYLDLQDWRPAAIDVSQRRGMDSAVMLTFSTYDKLISLLDTSGARYRIIEHAAEGRTDIASVLRSHSLAQAAKSIVVRVSITKKKGTYLLAVIPGDKHVDLAKLSHLTGGIKSAFAARNIAERLTASISGSIAPFSFNCGLQLIVDKSLLAHTEIFFNAARLDRSIALHMEDYLQLARPRVEHIAVEVTDRWGRNRIA
jgi:Ala-tRNA(Pro) deacylase